FLAFVGQGMKDGWDKAAQAHYGCNKVEKLEEAWLKWQRKRTASNSKTEKDTPSDRMESSLYRRPPRRGGEVSQPPTKTSAFVFVFFFCHLLYYYPKEDVWCSSAARS